jgi:hypothetical protein
MQRVEVEVGCQRKNNSAGVSMPERNAFRLLGSCRAAVLTDNSLEFEKSH